jgi:hypothetical protein
VAQAPSARVRKAAIHRVTAALSSELRFIGKQA